MSGFRASADNSKLATRRPYLRTIALAYFKEERASSLAAGPHEVERRESLMPPGMTLIEEIMANDHIHFDIHSGPIGRMALAIRKNITLQNPAWRSDVDYSRRSQGTATLTLGMPTQ